MVSDDTLNHWNTELGPLKYKRSGGGGGRGRGGLQAYAGEGAARRHPCPQRAGRRGVDAVGGSADHVCGKATRWIRGCAGTNLRNGSRNRILGGSLQLYAPPGAHNWIREVGENFSIIGLGLGVWPNFGPDL